MKSGIYKILNKVNGKFYIGSANKFNKRWVFHRWVLKNNIHTNLYLQRAWNKYGEENFEFIILEICETDKLSEREQFWIDSTNCYNSKIGYNMLKLAHSPMGAKRSLEQRARMSVAQKGKIMPAEGIEKIIAAKRDFDKWPHAKGSRCRCHECKYKKSEQSLAWLNAKKLKEAQNVQA